MAKKPYKVIGNLMGVPLGAIVEADDAAVEAQGLLGTLFEEAPEGSTLTDLSEGAASAPEPAVGDASADPKGNGGQTPNPSSPAGSGTETVKPKPVPPPPPAPKPVPPAPKPEVKNEEVNPSGAKPVVTPEEQK